jgi:hypothetical protein
MGELYRGPFTIFVQGNQAIGADNIDFGDGSAIVSGTGIVPPAFVSHTYAAGQANHTVTITETGSGCVVVGTVIMEEAVNAAIQIPLGGVTQVRAPGSMSFINSSTNVSSNTTFIWDFGDGATSTEEAPEYSYQEAGFYTIKLYANNEFNCPDSFLVEDAVFADNKGSIEFPTAFIPDPSGPNGGVYDPNSFRNDIFFPVFEGVIDYHLMIFNRWGEIVFETKDIGVGWDGYHQLTQNLLQQDVYVWRANVTFANQQTIETAGEVTLLR